ncbi:hypothetical protein N7468_009572 [Penicillium chermesinum]|uniref:Uncharacterized protein n=1 Tax=Penicillium chermesinum TaxID=63820 RepID=A0A9W9TF50_9EURO|nr:uncharacterized protein N7468_009572 [Penicillium chermesinum]KAJ5220368.1 hypothetical protein N7468_009572 [Penicillium chermesinum]KAJ6157809.1 hypothetical protein N7470_005401 [Penicillium chermesinum]
MIANISPRAIFEQPPECADYSNFFPVLPFDSDTPSAQFFTQVPLYQPENNHTDLPATLQECCHYKTWTYADPELCTAICNSRTLKQALEVQYCLNAQKIHYGVLANTGAVPTARLWAILCVGGLVLSMVMF